ncbi:MAG TPA: cation diffusion facilitator family transporter [Hyphomicrobiales bacterium]|mgnify:CR=1 FL=1|nr:cation transporter [Rhodobiaceae bacterium]HXK54404.1 cation diffusion facilitator family transporter [Hyphomicrobiales bacterium]
MFIKYAAYHITGSVALYSDALESIVNVVTAVAALVAIRIGAKPADDDHPFGHHKAEYFSAVLEGVLIVLAALLIFREVWFAFQQPRHLNAPLVGMAINAVSTMLNAGWCLVLIRLGRQWRSPALVADGWHLYTDVITSVGVLVGLGLVVLTGWAVLDPVMGAVVAANILWAGWKVVRESVDGLMDKAASTELETEIRAVISGHAQGAIEFHDLRTRAAGQAIFIEFHMVVPAAMSVADSHEICDRVEEALRREIAGARIVIHVEPEEKAKNEGVAVL